MYVRFPIQLEGREIDQENSLFIDLSSTINDAMVTIL